LLKNIQVGSIAGEFTNDLLSNSQKAIFKKNGGEQQLFAIAKSSGFPRLPVSRFVIPERIHKAIQIPLRK
jgi:hypothetical protein